MATSSGTTKTGASNGTKRRTTRAMPTVARIAALEAGRGARPRFLRSHATHCDMTAAGIDCAKTRKTPPRMSAVVTLKLYYGVASRRPKFWASRELA